MNAEKERAQRGVADQRKREEEEAAKWRKIELEHYLAEHARQRGIERGR